MEDLNLSASQSAHGFMERAIALSQLGFPSPNPRVGCVIVQNGAIVGEGFHAYAGGPHAEVVALAQAGTKAQGANVYVTLEPCNHLGRTPPCTEALIQAGVQHVAFAVSDPNPRASGGCQRLAEAGIATTHGLLAERAEAANVVWLTAMRRNRPYIALKVAMAMDGRIALPSGQSKWITSEQARAEGHRLRAEFGAVFVGAGTVLADEPLLTVRSFDVGRQPTKLVWDPNESVPASHPIWATADTHRVTGRTADAVLEVVASLGLTALLVEGGPFTWSQWIQSGLVDVIHAFIAPKLLGAGPSWLDVDLGESVLGDAQWQFDAFSRVGPDLYAVLKPRTP